MYGTITEINGIGKPAGKDKNISFAHQIHLMKCYLSSNEIRFDLFLRWFSQFQFWFMNLYAILNCKDHQWWFIIQQHLYIPKFVRSMWFSDEISDTTAMTGLEICLRYIKFKLTIWNELCKTLCNIIIVCYLSNSIYEMMLKTTDYFKALELKPKVLDLLNRSDDLWSEDINALKTNENWPAVYNA